MKKIAVTFSIIFIICISSNAKILNVSKLSTSQFASIQDAIDVSKPGDKIYVKNGNYIEKLTIKNKPCIIVGESPDSCLIQYDYTSDPNSKGIEYVVTINGTGSEFVEFYNIQIFGGSTKPLLEPIGKAAGAISSTKANLKIIKTVIDGIFVNSAIPAICIDVKKGSLIVENLELYKNGMYGNFAEYGICLNNCTATINNLVSNSAGIDHIVNIDNSTVTVKNSTIRANDNSWGDCVRIIDNCIVTIENNNFYRTPGGKPLDNSTFHHDGIGILESNNIVAITNNKITHLPVGIDITKIGINRIKVQGNIIENSENYAVCIENGTVGTNTLIDFGGGILGSQGVNYFVNTNKQYHFYVKNSTSTSSSGVIYAKDNYWTYTKTLADLDEHKYDLDNYIFDNLDDNKLLRIDYGTGENATDVEQVNNPPTFILSKIIVFVSKNSTNFKLTDFTMNMNDGNPGITQKYNFKLSNGEPELFTVQPSINNTGTLSFSTSDQAGTVKVGVILKDNGLIDPTSGNNNASPLKLFTIIILP
jgi:hypothetical protein